MLSEKIQEMRLHPHKLDNPYTSFTVEKLHQSWVELKEMVAVRDGLLAELKQKKIEEMREEYRTMFDKAEKWIKGQMDEITTIAIGERCMLEYLGNAMSRLLTKSVGYKNICDLEDLNFQMSKALTLPQKSNGTLRADWESMMSTLYTNLNKIITIRGLREQDNPLDFVIPPEGIDFRNEKAFWGLKPVSKEVDPTP